MPIQIETLESIKSDGFNLSLGDRITLDESIARRWCGYGWAKAVNGEIETGERRVIRAVLDIDGTNHENRTEHVNG